MRMFDLQGAVNALLTNPNIVSLLNSIELYKGKTTAVKKLKKIENLLTSVAQKLVVRWVQSSSVMIV